jgi:hypothetical protein
MAGGIDGGDDFQFLFGCGQGNQSLSHSACGPMNGDAEHK